MDAAAYTPIDQIINAVVEATFRSGKTRDDAFRKTQLAALAYMIKDNLDALCDAMKKDLHRNSVETILSDAGIVITEAKLAYNSVDKWSKDTSPSTPLTYKIFNLKVKPTPKGSVLIISPFNYPILLTFTPLVGAIAAGCTAVLKLPESLRHVSPLIENLVAKYLDPTVVRVVQGAVKETTQLLELQWDHIFFTGSERVGRIVGVAAAKQTTPTTMELGGKCPVIIDPQGADFGLISRRILWGRISNGGQTCVAPEYILIPREAQAEFVKHLQRVYKELYPGAIDTSEDYARLVNQSSAKRIKSYLDETKGDVVVGGKTNLDACFLEPTIVADVKGDDSIMKDEIFGPVLSVVPVESLDDAIHFISERPTPLALYVFSKSATFKEKVAQNTRSGSIVYNDTLLHVGAPGLPFGGTGSSGHGQYKGKYGFDTFTHFRANLDTPSWAESFMWFRYPPYTKEKLAAVRKEAIPSLPFDRQGQRTLKSKATSWLATAAIPVVIAAAYYYQL